MEIGHHIWLLFRAEIVKEDHKPLDFDQIGLIIEKHKDAK